MNVGFQKNANANERLNMTHHGHGHGGNVVNDRPDVVNSIANDWGYVSDQHETRCETGNGSDHENANDRPKTSSRSAFCEPVMNPHDGDDHP